MAEYTTPNEVHYIERDSSSSAGVWAVVIVLIALFAFLFFGTNVFGRRGVNTNTSPSTSGNGSINGSVQTPNGSGSGTINY